MEEFERRARRIPRLRSETIKRAHLGWFASIMEIRNVGGAMSFPVKVCVVCEEEFELKPDKPGFANRCPQCSAADAEEPTLGKAGADELKTSRDGNAARRAAIKDMLYSGK